MNQRVRERVPTPENDNRLNGNNPFNIPSIASGVALTAQQLATNPSIFPTSTSNNSMPILGTLLLSPIKESDSVNNTLSSGSMVVAPNNSILPLNIKSTNTQFGSLVVSSANHHDIDTNTTNSFVVLPATKQSDAEIIPVSITTVPFTTSADHLTTATTTGAIITELPIDQCESVSSSGGKRSSAPATPRLGQFFSEFTSSPKSKIQRQQSVESSNSFNPNTDDLSTSSNSTISKRHQANSSNNNNNNNGTGGKKHGEVYV